MIPAHICSLVATVRPAELDAVANAVAAMPGAEVAARDPVGKLIVTLETDHEKTIGKTLMNIEVLPGVLAAALVFHHVEPQDERQPEEA